MGSLLTFPGSSLRRPRPARSAGIPGAVLGWDDGDQRGVVAGGGGDGFGGAVLWCPGLPAKTSDRVSLSRQSDRSGRQGRSDPHSTRFQQTEGRAHGWQQTDLLGQKEDAERARDLKAESEGDAAGPRLSAQSPFANRNLSWAWILARYARASFQTGRTSRYRRCSSVMEPAPLPLRALASRIPTRPIHERTLGKQSSIIEDDGIQ